MHDLILLWTYDKTDMEEIDQQAAREARLKRFAVPSDPPVIDKLD